GGWPVGSPWQRAIVERRRSRTARAANVPKGRCTFLYGMPPDCSPAWVGSADAPNGAAAPRRGTREVGGSAAAGAPRGDRGGWAYDFTIGRIGRTFAYWWTSVSLLSTGDESPTVGQSPAAQRLHSRRLTGDAFRAWRGRRSNGRHPPCRGDAGLQ